MGERLVRNQEVAGSIPAWSTKPLNTLQGFQANSVSTCEHWVRVGCAECEAPDAARICLERGIQAMKRKRR